MTIVGFNISNETSVVVFVNNRSIDLLLNDEFKYETLSVVSFAERNRHFSFQGLLFALKKPGATMSLIKCIIGRGYKWPDMKEELNDLSFSSRRGNDGDIVICVDHAEKEPKEFTLIQILAMLLSNLRKVVEANAGGIPVSHLVIGVPSYFRDWERSVYLDAVEISGVEQCNVRLIHEGTAIVLGYGFYC